MAENKQSPALMENYEYPMELRDYWVMLMRRKFHFLIPLAAILATAVALAYLLPATYRSEATFLIQRQSIPQNVVPTTVTGYVQEQIQQIRQRLVAHDNLIDLAEKFYLYPKELASNPSAVVERLRKNIDVQMVDVTASDPDRGAQRGMATIAFTVAFTASTPQLARDVTQDLAERYKDMNRQDREAQAADVNQFLDQQAGDLSKKISAMEKKLATFKQGELQQLPEMMSMNLNLYERTQQDIDGSRERIRGLEDNLNSAQAELSLTEPYKEVRDDDGKLVLSASDRLSALTAEYLQDIAKYSPEHPDVIRLSREIKVLAQQTGTGARADELMTQLVRMQEQLRQAREKYSEDHPEVQRLEKSIAALQRGSAPLSSRPTTALS